MATSKSQIQSQPPTVTRSEDPWLLYHSNGGSQTFYCLSEGCSYQKTIQEMSSCDIVACSYGWLVMLGRDDADISCFLLNPVSMDKIKLPSCPYFDFSTCVLTSSPLNNSTNCYVMFLSSERLSILYCRPGDEEWSFQELPIDDNENYVKQAVTYGGKIHGLTRRDNLICIDVEANSGQNNPKFTLTELRLEREVYISPHSECPHSCPHLIESCGETFLVKVMHIVAPKKGNLQDSDDNFKYIIQTVEVFRLDLAEMVWEKVNSLGDNRAFLIGGSHNMSCPASSSATRPSRIKANCIYFSNNSEGKLYQFNIREKSMVESVVPCPNVVNISKHVWIVPHM